MLQRYVDNFGAWAVVGTIALTVIFLIAPIIVSILMSFDARGYLGRFPPTEFSFQWYARFFSDTYYLTGLRTSLIIAVIAATVSTCAGVCAAIVLDRYEFPGKQALETIFLSPLVIPAVVIGFSLLLFFALLGVFQGYPRLLAGHIIITFPYAVRTTLD